MEQDACSPGSNSDSDSCYDSWYYRDFPRAQRARRRQKLRTREPYPWRFFHLPRGTTRSNQRAFYENESDSESESVRRDKIILRPTIDVSTGKPRNARSPGLKSQAGDHLHRERENPSIAPHSCSYCSDVRLDFRTHIEGGETPLDIRRLRLGAGKGCLLCSSLLKDVDNVSSHELASPSDRIITTNNITAVNNNDLCTPIIDFHSSTVGHISRFDLYAVLGMSHRCNTTTSTELVHLQPPPNLAPNSQLSFNKLKGWLGECHSKHTACRSFQVEYMPRRLLEMTASAEAPRTRLCTDPPIAPYAALSYCWGRDQLSKTTRERLEQYRRDIPFRELPKTIRDAAKVTLAIGLKYLWVDALCIIQDDDEDKREQISKMCSVYRGAFFTIAASIATTADDGFLHPRIQYRPTKLAARTDDNVFTEVLLSPVYRRLDVVGSPLYLRGWTFQETQLSTRIAAYGEREMTLCCLEDAHIDGGTGRHVVGPTYRGVLDPGNLTFRSSGHPHSWARIIETYSGRSLSVESDKLPAIAALAEEYSLTKAVTDYFAGIWREGFLLYCLWYVPLPPMQRPPSTYVAPSWSWASMVEPISYRWTDIISLTDIEISCVLLDMGTTLASSHRFGIVTGGFMSIRARTRELALFGFDPDRTFGHPSLQAAALTAFHSTDAPNEDVRIECYMDIPTDWAAKTHVPLVGVEICTVGNGKDLVDVEICTDRYETETKAFGLVLEQIDADSYRRVGLLIVLDVDNRDYWFEDGLEPALWRDMLIK